MRTLIVALGVVGLGACGGGTQARGPAATELPSNGTTAVAEPLDSECACVGAGCAPDACGSEAATAGLVGVLECDEFLAKYTRCIDEHGADEELRRQTHDAVAQITEAWRQAAATEDGRVSLRANCLQMTEATKQATASLGCTW